jgi:hypothetical protein
VAARAAWAQGLLGGGRCCTLNLIPSLATPRRAAATLLTPPLCTRPAPHACPPPGVPQSSEGSGSADDGEWLMFQLAGPMARVRYLRLAVYRALYQAG